MTRKQKESPSAMIAFRVLPALKLECDKAASAAVAAGEFKNKQQWYSDTMMRGIQHRQITSDLEKSAFAHSQGAQSGLNPKPGEVVVPVVTDKPHPYQPSSKPSMITRIRHWLAR